VNATPSSAGTRSLNPVLKEKENSIGEGEGKKKRKTHAKSAGKDISSFRVEEDF